MLKLEEYVKPLNKKPKPKADGEVIYYIDRKLVDKDDEIAMGLRLVCNRYLFGLGYRQLMYEHFEKMGKNSGILIKPFAKSDEILPTLKFPGDIDYLIIPYENDELIVSKAIAVELKIIRAKFIKQDKSPNEFGFSQARGLIEAGFPYVGVIHLIVSDQSPNSYWREMLIAQVVDSKTGEIELLAPIKKDMMPSDLMNRAKGRLISNCPDNTIGLLSTYFDKTLEGGGNWFPTGRSAQFNQKCNFEILDRIGEYYYRNYQQFMDTRKYPEDNRE